MELVGARRWGSGRRSTAIRHALADGDLPKADSDARPSLRGPRASSPTVTSSGAELGFQHGERLRCPARSCCPPTGSTRVGIERADGSRRPRAIFAGPPATFYVEGGHVSLLEAHLLDFAGDLYIEGARCGSSSACGARPGSTPWTSWWPRSRSTATGPRHPEMTVA